MPPFGSRPDSLSCGLRKNTVTLVPSARAALVEPWPRSHSPRCSSSTTMVLPRGVTWANPSGRTVATRHTFAGNAVSMCSWRAFGIRPTGPSGLASNRDAPGPFADGNRRQDLLARGVDHRDGLRYAIGHVELLAIAGEVEAPRTDTHRNEGHDPQLLNVDDRDVVRSPVGDVGPLAAGVNDHALGLGSRAVQLEGGDDGVLGDVDHRDRAADLGGDERPLTVRREGRFPRTAADQDRGHRLERGGVDDRDRVGGLGGDVDEAAVGADRYPFRLRADRDRRQHLARLRVD